MTPAWAAMIHESRVPLIDTRRLKTLLDLGRETVLVDVRSEAEFRAGHLPAARHVAIGPDFEARAEHWIGQWHHPVVIYGSARSTAALEAAVRLLRHGLPEVYIYADGVEGWRNASLPLYQSMAA